MGLTEVAQTPPEQADYRPTAQGGQLSQEPAALLSEREVARMLGVSLSTLRRWRLNLNYGPPTVRIGRYPRYRREDVERWIEEQREHPPPE
jgi:predicted DNA-binding transcriptional regulator AlpA